MNELYTILARNLKMYRTQRQLTQEQLAEASSISKNYLAEIETERKYPSPEVFWQLAEALHIEPFQLLVNRSQYQSPGELSRFEEIRSALVHDVNTVVQEHLAQLAAINDKKPE
ncbi:MAG: helix-turn-helix domain-containing protein [Spirochaetes bacterium]|nr:helix-turn-helix domain-containing protein [Spirochaetota bacterium]MBU0955398.1 helix-turn-helix domain-containing protein [Spirochaetota bacterium]